MEIWDRLNTQETALLNIILRGDAMRVLILSWEYPPKVVGGIARHVHDLAIALVKKGIGVDVVTCGAQGTVEFEVEKVSMSPVV